MTGTDSGPGPMGPTPSSTGPPLSTTEPSPHFLHGLKILPAESTEEKAKVVAAT